MLDIEPQTDVAIHIALARGDIVAGSRRIRKISEIESAARALMINLGPIKGARCDVWDRERKLAWSWTCDGRRWTASDTYRPPPWKVVEPERFAWR